MILERIKFINKLYNRIWGLIDSVIAKHNISALIILKRFFISNQAELIFLIEDANWAIKLVGKYITSHLNEIGLIKAEIDRRYSLKNKIVHYGSINCILRDDAIIKVDESNKHVLTFFHISSDDYYINYLPYLIKKIGIIHTSNFITKKKLIEFGFDAEKITVIPLGIDLSIFKRFNEQKRKLIKERFQLPQDKIIIGSFQKDGVGWGKGLEPKMNKGPDIFCEVVKKLKEKYDIHVFLTGPARGYVKKQLEKYEVPYTHTILKNYNEMVYCYNALDLYIISSRAEGGPLALLEGMATGVPIISTKVGMAPDIIQNNVNGFLAEVNDIKQLYQSSCNIIDNQELRENFIESGLKIVQEYSWEKISKLYYEKLYKNLKFK